MTTLSVTARGQITLKRDLLQHMGVESGEKVEVIKLPDGGIKIQAQRKTKPMSSFFGVLKDKTDGKVLTVEDMNEIIKDGWSGKANEDNR